MKLQHREQLAAPSNSSGSLLSVRPLPAQDNLGPITALGYTDRPNGEVSHEIKLGSPNRKSAGVHGPPKISSATTGQTARAYLARATAAGYRLILNKKNGPKLGLNHLHGHHAEKGKRPF